MSVISPIGKETVTVGNNNQTSTECSDASRKYLKSGNIPGNISLAIVPSQKVRICGNL